MIITHALDAEGHSRVYLGTKASIECWLEPDDERQAWSFHIQEGLSGTHLDDENKRVWAIHILKALADVLGVPPDKLKSIPYETIADLHTPDPFEGRRAPAPRRQSLDSAYVATPPDRPPPRPHHPITRAASRNRPR